MPLIGVSDGAEQMRHANGNITEHLHPRGQQQEAAGSEQSGWK